MEKTIANYSLNNESLLGWKQFVVIYLYISDIFNQYTEVIVYLFHC